MIRASALVLGSAAILLAQGPPREQYETARVEKIQSYPDVPVYVYRLSGGMSCTMNTQLDVMEGSDIKIALEGRGSSLAGYLMDSLGKTHKCKQVVFGDWAVRKREPKTK